MSEFATSAFELADQLAKQIQQRTGLKPQELECPREKSYMTPCIARDGSTVVAFNSGGQPICIGCGIPLHELQEIENQKSSTPAHL